MLIDFFIKNRMIGVILHISTCAGVYVWQVASVETYQIKVIEQQCTQACHKGDLTLPKLPTQHTIDRIDYIDDDERDEIVDKTIQDTQVHGKAINDNRPHDDEGKVSVLDNTISLTHPNAYKDGEVIEKLKTIGAEGILVLNLEKIVL